MTKNVFPLAASSTLEFVVILIGCLVTMLWGRIASTGYLYVDVTYILTTIGCYIVQMDIIYSDVTMLNVLTCLSARCLTVSDFICYVTIGGTAKLRLMNIIATIIHANTSSAAKETHIYIVRSM